MAMPAWIPETWNRLSEDHQKQIADFMQFLLSKQERECNSPTTEKRKLGLLADRFEFIADDFDAPIDDFKEYL